MGYVDIAIARSKKRKEIVSFTSIEVVPWWLLVHLVPLEL